MIKSFWFKNFRSYSDETFVDLTVNQKTAHSYFDYEAEDGSKISKVLGVFGANGSGKSNLLEPLTFLSWFVPDSFGAMEKKEPIPIAPHFAHKEENTEIHLNFTFQLTDEDKYQFEYFIELNQTKVITETLKYKTSRLFSTILHREFDEETLSYSIKKNDKYVKVSVNTLKKVPNHCSILSFISQMESQESDGDPDNLIAIATLYFESINSNLSFVGRHNEFLNIESANKVFMEFPDLFEKTKSLLKQYDLGIEDITLEERIVLLPDGKEESRLIPMCLHKHLDKVYKVPLFTQSSGTISAYKLLAIITGKLKFGGVSILDEFDNDFHHELTQEIVNLFKNESTNPNNAQLIFTSHSPEMLKLLRKQHVYITEKHDCASQAWRANDVEGLRDRDNLYAKYISGALGGLPSFD